MSSYDNELAGIVAELNRAAPGSRTSQPASPEALAGLDQLLTFAVRQNASDLLVIAGAPVTMRMNGRLSPSEGPDLTEDDARNLLLPLLTPKQYQELQKDKSIDICFTRKSIGRFRLNLHHQRGSVAGSIRVLPSRIPTLQSLHLPPALEKLAHARQGLVLITGSTGSGKTFDTGGAAGSHQHAAAGSYRHHRRSHRVRACQPQFDCRADRGWA